MNTQKNKEELKADMRYELPSNQTPEDLIVIDNNSDTLFSEIDKLTDIIRFQSNEISRLEKQIFQSKQEIANIKSKISDLKTEKLNQLDNYGSQLKNSPRVCKQSLQSEIAAGDEVSIHRILTLKKMIAKNNEEFDLLERRLNIAEGLLGLK